MLELLHSKWKVLGSIPKATKIKTEGLISLLPFLVRMLVCLEGAMLFLFEDAKNIEKTSKTDTRDTCGFYAWWRPWCRQCLHTLPIIPCSSIISSLPPTSHLIPVSQTEDDFTTAWRTGQAVLGEIRLGSAVQQSSARPPFESFLFSLSLASSASAELMFSGFHIWI